MKLNLSLSIYRMAIELVAWLTSEMSRDDLVAHPDIAKELNEIRGNLNFLFDR